MVSSIMVAVMTKLFLFSFYFLYKIFLEILFRKSVFVDRFLIVRICVKCNLRDLVLMNVPWSFDGISIFLLNCIFHLGILSGLLDSYMDCV